MVAKIISIDSPRKWGRNVGIAFSAAVIGVYFAYHCGDDEPGQSAVLQQIEPIRSNEIGGAAIANPFSEGSAGRSDEVLTIGPDYSSVARLAEPNELIASHAEATALEEESEIPLNDGGEAAAAAALALYNQYLLNRATPRENFKYLVRLLYQLKLRQMIESSGPHLTQFYEVLKQAAQPALRDLMTQIQRNPQDLEGNAERYDEMSNAIWLGDEDPGLPHPDLIEVFAERDRILDILSERSAERAKKPSLPQM